jgi:hypothetical protein
MSEICRARGSFQADLISTVTTLSGVPCSRLSPASHTVNVAQQGRDVAVLDPPIKSPSLVATGSILHGCNFADRLRNVSNLAIYTVASGAVFWSAPDGCVCAQVRQQLLLRDTARHQYIKGLRWIVSCWALLFACLPGTLV